MVAEELVERQGNRVRPLEPKEESALVYVVAFDLSRLELGFALGTEHPRVNRSERVAPLVRTGMKGGWFIFDRYHAHEDWCRWRAPYWHGSRAMDARSHHNYHLGFRCCKTVANVGKAAVRQ